MHEANGSQSGEELLNRIERCRDAVNESASLVRNLYFSFLLLGTYIAVTIGATTDEQLLKGSPVTLPIINVELPIFAFYGVIPWLLLLFHMNLLMQCYLLSRRIHLFNAALADLHPVDARHEHRIGLFPFPFVQMMAGDPRAGLIRWLSAVIVWVTLILLPLLLVVAAQVAFLPYHDIAMTGWQRLAVLLDVVLIWIFWPMTVTPVGHSVREWWSRLWRGPVDFGRRLASGFKLDKSAAPAMGMLPLVIVTVPVLLFSTLIAVIPGEPLERFSTALLPDARHSVGGQSNLLTDVLFDAPGAILHRNLRLAGRIIVAGELNPGLEVALRSHWEEKRQEALAEIVGVDLANRDLRFADLRGTLIPKANLQGVNLDGADLRQAELQDADMRGFDISAGGTCARPGQLVDLPGEDEKAVSGLLLPVGPARVCRVSLRRAKLAEAGLIGASMALADLEEADLREAQLESAVLRGARLDHARLNDARLFGATLQAASLVKADLSGTTLRSSRLVDADLRSALLEETNLDGADLTGANLSGWRLEGVSLDNAIFSPGAPLAGARIRSMKWAKLEGADLSEADLRTVMAEGVLLKEANLRGADLSNAKLRGAMLTGADLSRAWLQEADLRLATMHGVDLSGATLSAADLGGSYLASSLLHGANLQAANLQLAMIRETEFTAADLAMARLGGAYIGSMRLDLADLRGLSLAEPSETEAKRVVDSLRFLQSYPNHLVPGHVGHLERGMPSGPRESLDGILVGAPILCDPEGGQVEPRQRHLCIEEKNISDYVRRLASTACDQADVAYGIARRAMVWNHYDWLARFYHRGKQPDAYPRLLAELLLSPKCPAREGLPKETIGILETLVAESGQGSGARN